MRRGMVCGVSFLLNFRDELCRCMFNVSIYTYREIRVSLRRARAISSSDQIAKISNKNLYIFRFWVQALPDNTKNNNKVILICKNSEEILWFQLAPDHSIFDNFIKKFLCCLYQYSLYSMLSFMICLISMHVGLSVRLTNDLARSFVGCILTNTFLIVSCSGDRFLQVICTVYILSNNAVCLALNMFIWMVYIILLKPNVFFMW